MSQQGQLTAAPSKGISALPAAQPMVLSMPSPAPAPVPLPMPMPAPVQPIPIPMPAPAPVGTSVGSMPALNIQIPVVDVQQPYMRPAPQRSDLLYWMAVGLLIGLIAYLIYLYWDRIAC